MLLSFRLTTKEDNYEGSEEDNREDTVIIISEQDWVALMSKPY